MSDNLTHGSSERKDTPRDPLLAATEAVSPDRTQSAASTSGGDNGPTEATRGGTPPDSTAAKPSWATEVEQLERERDLLWDAIDKITAYRGDTRHRAWVPAQIAVDALEALAAGREAHNVEYWVEKMTARIEALNERRVRMKVVKDNVAGPFTGRFVVLHDLHTEDFLPIGVLFEERDGTGTLRVFEDAEARDPHLSKMRREFESFEKAVSSWNRSALISTYTRIGACDATI